MLEEHDLSRQLREGEATMRRTLLSLGDLPEREELEARLHNFLYRVAYPKKRAGYLEAVQSALKWNDESLFELVRLLGRTVEKTRWFIMREERGSGDKKFRESYQEARQNPIDLPRCLRNKNASRLLLLSFYEPELSGEKPRKILAFLEKSEITQSG